MKAKPLKNNEENKSEIHFKDEESNLREKKPKLVNRVKKEKPLKKADIDLVRKLSRGITVPEIAAERDRSIRTIEGNTNILRARFKCKTLAHLVATFLRKEIIK
jgi:DNA-binding CsgD family transcriptional regulator